MRGFPDYLLSAALLSTIGCAESAAPGDARSEVAFAAPAPGEMMVQSSDAFDGPGASATAPGGMKGAAEGADKDRAAAAEPEGVSRKVIYNATLDLAVEDLDSASAKVDQLLASSGGYVAEETMTGSPGSTRSRFWRLRIPIDGFDGFVKSITALGELVRFNRTSQDVTAEFYDVEAQIKNKRVEEQTLQKMLEERSGNLEEVLKVETELSRVRGEIDRMEGRLRVLKNLTAMATLTLTIQERERFRPPAPVVADFPTQIARTWRESVDRLAEKGKDLVLFAVGQAIWLPFWAIGLLVAWVGGRRLVRRLVALARERRTPGPNPPSGDGGTC